MMQKLVFLGACAAVVCGAFAVPGAAQTSHPPGHTSSTRACKLFLQWYKAQNVPDSSVLGLQKVAPRARDTLAANFAQSSTLVDPSRAGSGVCGSVWYDPAHSLALVQTVPDSVVDVLLFATSSPLARVTTRDLSGMTTKRGVRLGMTPSQAMAIDGPAPLVRWGYGNVVDYHWGSASSVQYDLLLFFAGNKLRSIDYVSAH